MTTLRLWLAAAFALAVPFVLAQTAWPERPIRVIVPLPPGGPSDIVLRGAAEKMQVVLKQPIIVDNKPGAAGNLGAAEAARAAPDGYTWLWTTDTLLTVNPHVYPKLNFKPEDLQPVMRASAFSQTLVCNPALGFRSVADLVKAARQKRLTYASGGAGSPGHLTTELFKTVAGIEMTHIPYKGPAPAMQDVIGGQVDCGFLAGPTVLPMVRAGKLVALAVSGAKRSLLLADVPTVAEAGYPGFDATFSLVLFAPRGMSRSVIDAMHAALADALKQPDVVERLRQTDQEVIADSPEASAARLAADSRTWGSVARKIGLQLD
ncbi:MAG TPA: tripartite tricarboxylate transporter substrate binding protein [Ramlibacter sp.]|nr:tripartite tricarboxylate transporter substrate binding protein [Ramlibacter sp.]